MDYSIERLRAMNKNVVWTHKIHEKQADFYFGCNRWLQVASLASIAFSITGIVSDYLAEAVWLKIGSLFFATIALFVSLLREAKDFEGLAYQHKDAAKECLAFRCRIEGLCQEFLCGRVDEPCIQKEIKSLNDSYMLFCRLEPRTTNMAVKEAENALKNGDYTPPFPELDFADGGMTCNE